MPSYIVNGQTVTAALPDTSWIANGDGTYSTPAGIPAYDPAAAAASIATASKVIKAADDPVRVQPGTLQAANSFAAAIAQATPQAGLK